MNECVNKEEEEEEEEEEEVSSEVWVEGEGFQEEMENLQWEITEMLEIINKLRKLARMFRKK